MKCFDIKTYRWKCSVCDTKVQAIEDYCPQCNHRFYSAVDKMIMPDPPMQVEEVREVAREYFPEGSFVPNDT